MLAQLKTVVLIKKAIKLAYTVMYMQVFQVLEACMCIEMLCIWTFRTVLLEHHNQRARDACSLITDLLTTPLTLPTNANRTLNLPSTSSRPSSTRPLTAQTVGSTRSSPRYTS